jgi:hypothetical protein
VKHTLNELSKRTDLVLNRAERASDELRRCFHGRIINGWGIYSDPSQVRSALQDALTHIQAALNTMRDTDWPSNQDYDALEAAHNRK